MPGVQVPEGFAVGGKLTLNVSGTAVKNFYLAADGLAFDARFKGISHHINAPVGAIIGVYALENGEGMAFPREAASKQSERESAKNQSPEHSEPNQSLPSYLKLVKE